MHEAIAQIAVFSINNENRELGTRVRGGRDATSLLAESYRRLLPKDLIRGGYAESALVCDRERWLNVIYIK